MIDEHRDKSGSRSLKMGQILFGEPQECCDCLVWDMNRSGAMIEVGAETELPEEFQLTSAAPQMKQICRMVWRQDRKVGVKFVR